MSSQPPSPKQVKIEQNSVKALDSSKDLGDGNLSIVDPSQKLADSLERLKLWLDLGKFVLGSVIVGIFTAIINAQIQYKQIALNRQQIEQQHLSQFIEEAMSDRLIDRTRFAKYFATLTLSDDFRSRWEQYYEQLEEERITKEERLAAINAVLPEERVRANSTGNNENLSALLEEKEALEGDVGAIARVFSSQEQFWNDEKLDSPIVEESSFTWRQAIVANGNVRIPTSPEVVEGIEQMAAKLQEIQAKFDQPIKIIHWYRQRPFNDAVGGSRRDSHHSGSGVDIQVSGYTSKELAEQLSDWDGGMGIHPESPDVLHLDNGSKRRWSL